MYLGQAINYLNPRTVDKFMITANKPLLEIDLKKGCSKVFDKYELKGEVLNREVYCIDMISGKILIEMNIMMIIIFEML